MDINVKDPLYRPERLIAHLKAKFRLDTDQSIARLLGIDNGKISLIRSRKERLGANVVLRILHVCPDMTLKQIFEISGIKQPFASIT